LLGVCLGAQLIADALGGRVVQNPVVEIGWFPVRFLDRQPPFDGFPGECVAFHWHGDTFSLPPGARRIAESDGCANQAFMVGEKIVGLQFHVEVTPAAAATFCEGADHILVPERFVQTRAEIERAQPDLAPTDAGLFRLLDGLASA
jgi:GMP synthase-like glutamine amidotransferase